RILHRIGDYEYQINHRITTVNSINYTLKALSINKSSFKGACKKFTVKNYLNLGIYFKSIGLYSKSINYFDSAISFNRSYKDQAFLTSKAIFEKIDAYFNSGDYQKDAEECSFYINIAKATGDSVNLPNYYNQRAQAFA